MQQWSDELLNVASFNVLSCQVMYDFCHITPTFQTPGQGQNIFLLGYTNDYPNLSDVIDIGFKTWTNQSQYAVQADLDNFIGYSQNGGFVLLIHFGHRKIGRL